MADERIDIEVTDKVNSNVETKLRAIGDAAGKSHTYVKRLKSELASMNTTALSKLQTAANSASRALANEMRAQAALARETSRATLIDAKAATEKQRLATETARTEAAEARAAAATARAATAQLRSQQATQRAASAKGNLADRAQRLKASLDPLVAAQDRFNAEINEANTLLRAGAINMNTYQQAVAAADTKLKAAHTAQRQFNSATAAGGRTAQLSGHQMANLGAQISDVGVSLASGQKPWLVFLQQGSQIQYLASTVDGGFKTLGRSALTMAARFWPLAVAIAAVGGALYALKSAANDNAGLDEYTRSLGLTKDELKELEDVTVTYGDTAKAVFQVIGRAIWERIGGAVTTAWGYISEFLSNVWEVTKTIINRKIGLWVGAYNFIVRTWRRWPAAIADVFMQGVNGAIRAINFLVQKAVDGVNFFINAANAVLEKAGLDLPTIEAGRISEVRNQYAGAAAEIGGAFAEEMSAAIARDYIGEFADAVIAQAIENAKARLAAQAAQIIEDRPESRGRNPRTARDEAAEAALRRAVALELLNLQLDNELATMRLLSDERAIQQRMDSIEEELARKRITLNDEERAAIESKVRAIEEYKYVQAEMDSIYEAAVGPLRTYNATIEAANDLLQRGAISQEHFNRTVGGATRAYQDSQDPLAQYRRDLESSEQLLGLYGEELEYATYLQRIMNDLAAKYGGAAEAYREEATALMQRNRALQDGLYVQQTVAGFMAENLANERYIASMQAMYAEVDRLRQQDLVSHEEAERLKAAIQHRYQEIRLGGFSDFFGELASLQSSGSKELAAIGKAAAVAQATIDGYLAVQKALASAPPPLNFAMAAAVAIKTGAQVAGILSTNVGNFATGGQFMVEGKSGIDTNNINMNVSRGERVTVETPAQQRANDSAGGNVPSQIGVKVVNITDPREALAALDTAEGDQLIVNKIERNASAIKRILGQ